MPVLVPAPVPVLVPVPVPVLVPVPGVWFVLKNLELGGQKSYPWGWRAPWHPPQKNLPKPMKNQCFASWSLLERPQSVLEQPKTI